MKIIILIPIYNDWQSVFKLLENIDSEISNLDVEASVLIVNDASTEPRPEINLNINNIRSIKVISMKVNKGHARCNAAGLKYINEKENFDYVIPMDGDGEDRPEEIKLLINKVKDYPDNVITANRIKRSEGFLFKFCYWFHKFLTYLFTGKSIKFGNYTCLTRTAVDKMTKDASSWSSFSGSLTKLTKERISIPSIRGPRYFGPTKMSFFNLLKHSFAIIAVFKTTMLIRSIIFLIVYFFLISKNISSITLIPIVSIFLMNIAVFFTSTRENITEFNNSLENIINVEDLE